ncbi:MAG: DNA repair protein [Spirochaetia bacterium]|nr:DNA repair protein [Spirochaetia bacterium]
MMQDDQFPCIDYYSLERVQQLSFITSFSDFIWDWYESNKRNFIWRDTIDPYHILLSELMLQQTQTERVVPKYNLFLELWPTLFDLSEASLVDILHAWKGLGYNRRAKALHTIAKESERYNYTLPDNEDFLLSLPMIGSSTSSAILSFAYEKKSLYLETNIRRIIIHHFFDSCERVRDKEIIKILSELIEIQHDFKNWYYALMDYGVALKKQGINPNTRSFHYKKQSPFENSNRQVRSTLLFIITQEGIQREIDLINKSPFEKERILIALESLQQDGLLESVVREDEVSYRVPHSK